VIDAKHLKEMVRWKEKDMDEVKFSDYEIYHAMNEVLRYLRAHLANMQSDLLEREKVYEIGDFVNGAVELPDDFTSVKGVYRLSDHYRLHAVTNDHVTPDTFRLFAGRIYAEAGILLHYYGSLFPVKEGDPIPLPDTYVDPIVKLTRMVMNNTDVDTMTQAVTAEVDAIVPRRKWSNARAKMPFFV
jgi:hypothetical protein